LAGKFVRNLSAAEIRERKRVSAGGESAGSGSLSESKCLCNAQENPARERGTSRTRLKTLYQNARSIRNKVNELTVQIEINGYDLVGIAETWLLEDRGLGVERPVVLGVLKGWNRRRSCFIG